MYRLTDIWRDRDTYQPSIHLPNMAISLWLFLNVCKNYTLFKANFLHLNGLKIILENLQTTLGINTHWIYRRLWTGHEKN